MSLIKKICIFLNQEAGRGLSKRLPAHIANKPKWHKKLSGVSGLLRDRARCMCSTWSQQWQNINLFAVLSTQRCRRERRTHSEDFLRLPARSHVGVMDLLEDHPGFVVLPHLTGGRVSDCKRRNLKHLACSVTPTATQTLKIQPLDFFPFSWVSRQQWLFLFLHH